MLPKIISLLLAIFLSYPMAFTQVSIERMLISPFGGYVASSNLKIADSAGEVSVDTRISGSFILTEGFQQALENDITGIEDFSILVAYQVYPNPVRDRLSIAMTFPSYADIQLEVFDLTGKQLPQLTKRISGSGKVKRTLSFKGLPSGMYILRIKNSAGGLVASQKIQKL